jgi:2-phosphoglycerate kinase
MIYLIGGAPRTGKTTLAKQLSKKLKISWISTDTLEVIAREYISEKDLSKAYPYTTLRRANGARNNDEFYSKYSSAKIVKVLKDQAKTNHDAIEAMIANEIDNGNDYIMEGYHLLPGFVSTLIKKYGRKNFKAVFLTKFDAEKFAKDVHKSSTPNDWLLLLTKEEKTFVKVGKMVAKYSELFKNEAAKNRLMMINMDEDFEANLKKAIIAFTA